MLTVMQSSVVAVFTQGLLYGIYLETLIQCFRWFIFIDEGWEPRKKINSYSIIVMAFGSIFIFLMITITIMATLVFMINSLWPRRDEGLLYGMMMVTNISQALAIISVDGILIYRCWIVYERSWRIICVPVTFWLGLLACSIIYVDPNLFVVLQIAEKVMAGLYVCNIATTVYTTIAIIYRIWHTTRAVDRIVYGCRRTKWGFRMTKTGPGSPKRLDYTMRILAESGALYTFTIIFSLVGAVLTAKSDPTWVESLICVVSDAINICMAGISFNLLIIRVNQSRVEQKLQDTRADSGNYDAMQTLPIMQFNESQITAPAEGPPSNAQLEPVDEVIDEIQEHRRSSDRMHVN